MLVTVLAFITIFVILGLIYLAARGQRESRKGLWQLGDYLSVQWPSDGHTIEVHARVTRAEKDYVILTYYIEGAEQTARLNRVLPSNVSVRFI